MTVKDLGRFVPRANRSPGCDSGPHFFFPGVDGTDGEQERAYERLRATAATVLGDFPHSRRIFSLHYRLAGRDGRVEVGKPDPVHGDDVLAIFDVGGKEPYSVHTAGSVEPVLRLGRHVYTVTEFARTSQATI